MKKRMEEGKGGAALAGALLALALMAGALAAPREARAAVGIDTGRQDCSITFTLDGEFPELDTLPVTVRVYRVADVDVSGNYTPVEPYGALELGGPGKETTAQLWQDLAAQAMEITSGTEGLQPAAECLVARMDGEAHASGKIEGLGTGMYLVTAADVLSDTYIYSFTPYLAALPNNYYHEDDPDTTDDWLYGIDSALKPEQRDRLGDLVIDKSLRTYNQTLGPATFIFQVTAEKDGRQVYNDVVSVNFDGTGSKSVRITGIPAGAAVTVTEVYSGASYQAVGSTEQTVTIVADTDMHVAFENEYDDHGRGGLGVVNHFAYTPGEEGGSWQWQKSDDSTGE